MVESKQNIDPLTAGAGSARQGICAPAFFAALIALLLCGCASMQPDQHGIPNFGVVDLDTKVFRGGQPTPQGWVWLRESGVTNDVKLNTDQEGYEEQAHLQGLKIKRFPVTTRQQALGGAAMALMLCQAEREVGPGTFVHCSHGKNRTGTLVAYWRVRECGWTKEQAMSEALSYGWADSLPGLKHFWKEVSAD